LKSVKTVLNFAQYNKSVLLLVHAKFCHVAHFGATG